MSELKKICLELDDLVLEYFITLDEIYRLQSQLDANLKDGMLLMAKARYSMGHRAVGIIQCNVDDMVQSFANVQVEDSELHKVFKLTAEDSLKGKESESGVETRKRNVKHDGVDGTGVEEVKDHSTSQDKVKKKMASHTDLLKWFGVLVPPVLRKSQGRFRTSVELVCDIASHQSKLLTLKERYRTLFQEKKGMLKGDDTQQVEGSGEEIEGEHLTSHSASSLSSIEDLADELAELKQTEE